MNQIKILLWFIVQRWNGFYLSKGVSLGEPKPKIDEFNWGAKEPSVQIQFSGSGTDYQAMPFSVDQAFNPKK